MTKGAKPFPQASPEDVARWRGYEEMLRGLERFAELDPGGFRVWVVLYTLYLVAEQRKLQEFLRRHFGVEYLMEWDATEAGSRYRTVTRVATDPRCLPRTRAAKALYETTCLDILTIEALLQELLDAAAAVDRGDAYLDRAFGAAFLWYFRHLPAFYGAHAGKLLLDALRDGLDYTGGVHKSSLWARPRGAPSTTGAASLSTPLFSSFNILIQ